MIKITRYSETGWSPRVQYHLLKKIRYYLDSTSLEKELKNLEHKGISDYTYTLITNGHIEEKENILRGLKSWGMGEFRGFIRGIWAFPGENPREDRIELYLNHREDFEWKKFKIEKEFDPRTACSIKPRHFHKKDIISLEEAHNLWKEGKIEEIYIPDLKINY